MARPKKQIDAPDAGNDDQAASVPAFIFIGDKNGHGPASVDFRGLTFVKNGDAVEVTDKAAAAKLANNNHFKAV